MNLFFFVFLTVLTCIFTLSIVSQQGLCLFFHSLQYWRQCVSVGREGAVHNEEFAFFCKVKVPKPSKKNK